MVKYASLAMHSPVKVIYIELEKVNHENEMSWAIKYVLISNVFYGGHTD